MTLCVDEWTAFMHAFDDELVGGLTTFYDVVVPYEHHRAWRTAKGTNIKIPRPQLSILAGSTPSNLIKFMPPNAWDQGFTSRIILVYSDERFVGDDFASTRRDLPEGMIHDLKVIYSLQGEAQTTEGYRKCIANWRANSENPKPTHPKLAHYNTRRRAHLYKLSMVSAVDRGNELVLDAEDYQTALGWLTEAEMNMPGIFEAGSATVDARAIDEIVDFIRRQGKPVPHHRIVRETAQRVPSHTVLKVIEIMWLSGRIKKDGETNTYLVRED